MNKKKKKLNFYKVQKLFFLIYKKKTAKLSFSNMYFLHVYIYFLF